MYGSQFYPVGSTIGCDLDKAEYSDMNLCFFGNITDMAAGRMTRVGRNADKEPVQEETTVLWAIFQCFLWEEVTEVGVAKEWNVPQKTLDNVLLISQKRQMPMRSDLGEGHWPEKVSTFFVKPAGTAPLVYIVLEPKPC